APVARGASGRRAPDRREPRALRQGYAVGPVIVLQLDEAGGPQVPPPGVEGPKGAVAPLEPAFLVAAARVGAEEHATGLQRCTKRAENPWQLLRRHVEQGRIGEDPVEARGRQIRPEEVLLPDFAAAVGARHRGEGRRAFEADRDVAAV